MNPNPLNGQMSFRDAAIVATILMLSTIATLFLPAHTYDIWASDTIRTAYDLFVFGFSAWITAFCTLTGLSIYAKRKEATST